MGVVALYVAVILLAALFAKMAMLLRLDTARRAFVRKAPGDDSLEMIFVFLSFLTLFLFAALSVSGMDYEAYRQNWFLLSPQYSVRDYVTGEWAYMLLNRVVYVFTQDFRVFNAIFSALTLQLVYCTLYDLRKEVDYSWAVLVYGLMFYLPMFNTKRICLAAAIIFFGVRYLLRKEYWKYAVCIFVAAGVHRTALAIAVFFAAYLLRRWITDKRCYIPVIFLCGALAIAALETSSVWLPILTALAERYAGYFSVYDGIGLGILARYLLLFGLMVRWRYCAVVYWNRVSSKDENLWRIVMLSTCASMIFAFAGYVQPIFSRMSTYAMYSYVLFLPYLIRQWKTAYREQKKLHLEIKISAAVIAALLCFQFFDYANSTLVSSGLSTYTTIWGWQIG